MRKIYLICLNLLFFINILFANNLTEPPELPDNIYGEIYINNKLADVNNIFYTQLEDKIVEYKITEAGVFGDPLMIKNPLVIFSTILDINKEIYFYIIDSNYNKIIAETIPEKVIYKGGSDSYVIINFSVDYDQNEGFDDNEENNNDQTDPGSSSGSSSLPSSSGSSSSSSGDNNFDSVEDLNSTDDLIDENINENLFDINNTKENIDLNIDTQNSGNLMDNNINEKVTTKNTKSNNKIHYFIFCLILIIIIIIFITLKQKKDKKPLDKTPLPKIPPVSKT